MDTHGTILVPPGVKIEVTGTSSRVKVKLCSWEELVKKVGLDLTTENDKHYQELLQQASKGTYNHRGMDASLSGGIFNRLSVSDTGFVLKNPIVLESLSVQGMSTRTKILASPEIIIEVKGIDSQVEVKPCSWKKLAKKAHLI
jgi:hypothetical protein